MNRLSNEEYYAYRANVERELADRSNSELVANIHREMANLYLDQSSQSDEPRRAIFLVTTAVS